MNNQRRKELERACTLLSEAKDIVEMVQAEEQECFDNLTEGLAQTERGQQIEEYASRLEDVVGYLEEQEDELVDIISG